MRNGTTLFNEHDPFAAQWLRNLFPEAIVDERSIHEIAPADLVGHDRVHCFGGIGGWELALRLAGWPADRPIWSGSCPCQPYSSAGKQKGDADERNLWPEMFRLIRECRPAIVVGEQVDAAIGHGWLDGVFLDLEGIGYACCAAVLPAASVQAPHARHRIYWMAHSQEKHERWRQKTGNAIGEICTPGAIGGASTGRSRGPDALEYADVPGENERPSGWQQSIRNEHQGRNPWSDFTAIKCGDGTARRIEPGTLPLVDGVPRRLDKIRGYGNAIVPQVAAEFIRTVMEIIL